MRLFNFLRYSVFLGLAGLFGAAVQCSSVNAQAEAGAEELHKAVGRLASPTPSDWLKSESTLATLVKNPTERERATCAMALFYMKRANFEAIGNLGRQVDKLFPQPSPDSSAQLLRIQLWHDLVDEQTDNANKHFSNLLESTRNSDLSKASRLANADILGAVVGMLESDTAQSPITRDQLSRAKTTLTQFNQAELVHAFAARYKQTSAHSAKLAEWFQAHSQQSTEEAERAAKSELDELKTASQNLDKSVAEIRLEKQEIDRQVRQLRLEKVRVNSETAAVQATWRKHPEVHNPREPNRNAIQVPTTKRVKDGEERVKKYKTVVDKNGVARREEDGYEYETKYKTISRSQAEIDFDIDRIYIPMLREYQRLMTIRQALQNKKAALDAKATDLNAKMSDSERELDARDEAIRTQMKELKDLQASVQFIEEALRAHKSGKPYTAFRPPHFEIVNYSAERRVLIQ